MANDMTGRAKGWRRPLSAPTLPSPLSPRLLFAPSSTIEPFHRLVKTKHKIANIKLVLFFNLLFQADDVPFAVKTSSELLTEESYLYIRTVIILCSALGVFVLAGLIWHFCFYKNTVSPQPSGVGMKGKALHLIF